MGILNTDEFDTIMDLIIAILFMGFGMVAIVLMVTNLNKRIAIVDVPDKIEYRVSDREVLDPFYFTGYQAYMFAWHMDDLSYEPLCYVAWDNEVNQELCMIDGYENSGTVRLSVLDESGQVRSQFIPWRNQFIVGTGLGEFNNVKDVMADLWMTAFTGDTRVEEMYKNSGSNKIMWHLRLTDEHKEYNNLGDDPNTGGKTFEWILRPVIVN